MIAIATSAHTMWGISLGIAFGAAVVAAILLVILVTSVDRIEASGGSLLSVATRLAGQTEHIPELAATAPVVGQIVDELHVQDDYMNALTDGFGGE